MINGKFNSRWTGAAVAFGIATLGIAGCSSNADSSPSQTPSASATETKVQTLQPTTNTGTAQSVSAPCTKEAILVALPSAKEVIKFKCAGGWASASVAPEAYPILKQDGSKWVATKASCGVNANASLVPADVYKQLCNS